jgi:DNA-binding NarL/FixJ family response regulator
MPIRLLIVDDQAIIRRGLATILELEESLAVVGEAANGAEAIAQVAALQPDVVLMDVRMPVMDGVAATLALMGQPSQSLKILILTTFEDTTAASQALGAGAAGYLLKDTPIEELVQAIQLVHRGYSQLAPGLAQRLLGLPSSTPLEPLGVTSQLDSAGLAPMAPVTALTPREQEILTLIAQGSSNREIAQQLYISDRTVRNHVTNILGTLGLRDRTQAAIFVHQQKVHQQKPPQPRELTLQQPLDKH